MLVNMKSVLEYAGQKQCCIGAFDTPNLEILMAVLNAAEKRKEPVIIYRKCVSYLKEKNIEIVANYVGELLTVQEQAGFQMFMARMDDELLHYWNAPCNTPYMKR